MAIPGVYAGRHLVRGAVLGACAGAVLMAFTHRASSLELGLFVGVVLEVLRAWVRGDLLEERPLKGTVARFLRAPSPARGGPEAAALEEPLVTVVAEVDCFDVGLREDIPAAHPQVVEELIAELADRDGVASVHRYGPAALVVDVPDWDELRLKLWLTLWLQRHLPR